MSVLLSYLIDFQEQNHAYLCAESKGRVATALKDIGAQGCDLGLELIATRCPLNENMVVGKARVTG